MELTLTGMLLSIGAALLIILCLIFAGTALSLDWVGKDKSQRKQQYQAGSRNVGIHKWMGRRRR